jgi:hypothetical protein
MTQSPDRFPTLSQNDRYLTAVAIGVLLLIAGMLLAVAGKDDLPAIAVGGVLLLFGTAGGTVRSAAIGTTRRSQERSRSCGFGQIRAVAGKSWHLLARPPRADRDRQQIDNLKRRGLADPLFELAA